MSLLSAALLLILVMDPLGNIPFFLSVLKGVDPSQRRRVIVRELCIALAILVLFLFGGKWILAALQIDQSSLSIAGGIVLFLIALGMVFPIHRRLLTHQNDGDPFIVPLAVPLTAGPSAIATVMLLMGGDPSRWMAWLTALVWAWLVSLIVLLLATGIERVVGDRALAACERLMGMVLTIVAVQMFLNGLREFACG